MRRVWLLMLVLLVVTTLGGVASAVAMGEEAPYFGVESKRLGAKEKESFTTTKTSTAYTMEAAGIQISCTGQSTVGGVLVGSAAGEPGTREGTVEFTGCTTTGNGSPCAVKEPLKTTPLIATSAYASNKKSVIVVLEPKSGTIFLDLTFTGTCTNTAAVVEGSVAAEALSGSGVLVELGLAPTLEVAGKINFPGTLIKTAWVVKGGVGESRRIHLLAFSGAVAKFVGETSIELDSKKKWCVIA